MSPRPRDPMSGHLPVAQPLGSKIGYDPTKPPDRTRATPSQTPQVQQGKTESRSRVDTYFTKADGETYEIYSGDRQWTKVTLTLETAGPVAIGVDAKLDPVTSGIGALLLTGEPMSITIAKGTKLYVVSESVNRVRRQIEPLPWLEQILGSIQKLFGR